MSYLVLCIRLKALLPGKLTIPEQIEKDRTPYYNALEGAGEALAEGRIDPIRDCSLGLHDWYSFSREETGTLFAQGIVQSRQPLSFRGDQK